MVEFEIGNHGEDVHNSKEIVAIEKKGDPGEIDIDLQITNSVQFVNKEIPSLDAITSKVQLLFEKLQKLSLKQDQERTTLTLPSIGSDDCIGMSERDSAVTSIKCMQRFYNYGSDTLATAVSFMDRFICKVKVKRRYLSCVTAACFYLATKMNEEFEHQPTASDLSRLHRHMWKPTDLKRMEKIVLDKLNWDLFPAVTTLSFLHIVYAMLRLVDKKIDRHLLLLLVERAELYMNYTTCSSYRSSTLAVSIVHQCLKESGLSSMVINFILLHVQSACQISDSELFDCQCAISKQFEVYNLHPATHPLCLPLPKIMPRPNLVTKPSCYGNTDLPTIEEVPYSCESSEEEEMLSFQSYLPAWCSQDHVQSSAPCVIQPSMDVTQSYCFVTDQCYCGTVGAFYSQNKCNITEAES